MQPVEREGRPVVIVELRRPAANRLEYTTVATLTVFDDHTWSMTGASELFDTSMPIRLPGSRHKIDFAENPVDWAANLPSRHRTGYLVAAVTDQRQLRRRPLG